MTVVVNSLEDTAQPAADTVTLRSAIAQVGEGQRVIFASSLDGGVIRLKTVGESHSILKGETYSGMTYTGYADRDYGKSALYARKSLVIDASNLPNGITIRWDNETEHARVLAVYGDLTLRNVVIEGGHSAAESITGGTQPYTLARGGGLAVWGKATLSDCAVIGNKITGDVEASRDRGTYGGGIYANDLQIDNCIISGNSAKGYGAAGGGIYSVGGADNSNSANFGNNVTISRSSITGNRTTGQHSYGGGIFTLGGGPTNLATMTLTNCTVARNLVEDNPDLPEVGQFYYRGGGVYMGGGSLRVVSSTIVENEVNGNAAVFSGKPNVGGGGIAATIGNAHVVEDLTLQHSIVAGNKLLGAPSDVFSGSVLNFYSFGYNLFGTLDFSQILVPVPDWLDLNRKHYPKVGDLEGVALTDAVSLSQVKRLDSAVSAGVDAGQPAVLWYPPAGSALDKITQEYRVRTYSVGYTGFGAPSDDFLNYAIAQVRTKYGATLGSDFGSSFGDMTGTTFFGPAVTWPTNTQNAAWISFWRNMDKAIGDKLGMAQLGEDYWSSFSNGDLGHVKVSVFSQDTPIRCVTVDQRGTARSSGNIDIGAVEN